MTDERTHQPKLAALAAYRERRLRNTARGRLERHLEGCATCREALLGMERFAVLSAELQKHPEPEIDWSRFTPVIEREQQRLRFVLRFRRFAIPLALAAAAALAALALRQPSHLPPPAPELARRPAPTPAPALLPAWITAIAGSVTGVAPDGARLPLTLASNLGEGWRVETDASSELQVALDGIAAVIATPGSSLELQRLREQDVRLALARGSVVSRVQKRPPGVGYEVLALGRRIAVRGTHFSVEASEQQGLTVQVDEGFVVVLGEDGQLLAELHAPARWHEQPGSHGHSERIARALARPLAAEPGSMTWPKLEIPTFPHVVSWEVRQADLASSAQLQLRVPVGDVDVRALLDDGRRMQGRVHVDVLGARFDPRALRFIGPPPPALARAAEPTDPNEAAAVIHRGEPELQRCYERALRGQADAPTAMRLKLRIGLDARGAVKQVGVSAETPLPGMLEECVRHVAERWQFSAPGGAGITFEAPIRFHAAR